MTRHLPAIAFATVVLASSPAAAQSVNYTDAEQLFGEPVTTAATGKPQRVSDVPVNMDIVTAEQIRRSGADNIPDVLRFVAGVDVRRYGQLDAAVGIRGYNTALNPRVLVLVDGRQVYQDDYGFVPWPLIPVALRDIRQIEIIKGPSAALYGFNAVSGVINIVTFDPLRDKVNGVTAEGGSQHRGHGEATVTAQIPGSAGIRLSAEGFRADEFSGVPSNGIARPETGSAAADARVQVAPGVEWDLSGSAGKLQSQYFIDTGSYGPLNDEAYSIRSRLAAETAFGLAQLDVYRNQNAIAEKIVPPVDLLQHVTVVQASDIFKIGTAHTFRLGAEYRENAISSVDQFNGTLSDRIAAASAMWEWQVAPQVTLTNAVRVDALWLSHQGPQFTIPGGGALYRDVDLVEPSFNSGIVWKPTGADTVRLSAARAVQLPSLVDFGVKVDYGTAVLAGNPGLLPSAVTNFEVDYDRSLAVLPAILRLALFAQSQDNSIGSPFGSGVKLLPTGQVLETAQNFGSSRELGGELGMRGSTGFGLRWNASYALAAVRDDTPASVTAMAPAIAYQRQTPVHSVIAGLGYSWGRFDVDVQARWQSEYQDFHTTATSFLPVPVKVADYVTADAHLAYHITDTVTASLTAQQFNAATQTETAGAPVERRIFAGVKADF